MTKAPLALPLVQPALESVEQSISTAMQSFQWQPLLPPLWIYGQARTKGRPRGRIVAGKILFYTPATTRLAEHIFRESVRPHLYSSTPWSGPVKLEILFVLRRPKKQQPSSSLVPLADLDNLEKLIDALNQIVWADDRQIVQVNKAKTYPRTPGELPHTELAIWGA